MKIEVEVKNWNFDEIMTLLEILIYTKRWREIYFVRKDNNRYNDIDNDNYNLTVTVYIIALIYEEVHIKNININTTIIHSY